MIKMKHITKKYGDTVILEDCDYTFPQNGVVCLLGASGGGKTTLLNLLAGFDTDYKGEITVGGTAIHQMNADELCRYRKDNIGFVFQNYHLLPGYTALENVMLASALTDENQEDGLKKARNLLCQLGIENKMHQKIETLSGGQKQRVAIARALVGNPQIIFADEPTGALDRKSSIEIMELLHRIAQERLIVVITHDQKICAFADEMIHIQNKKITVEQSTLHETEIEKELRVTSPSKISSFSRGFKNFKVHIKQYTAISIAISIGILAFLFSLSFGNVTAQSIERFKEKNTAFHNGYIKGTDDGTILEYLNKDHRIKNVYYQYKLGKIALWLNGKTEILPEKVPTPKAVESMSYGIMPRREMNEIAITPSLAKKFDTNIKILLGKELALEFENQRYVLTVSGIYNAGYDDFFISSDIEQKLYENLTEQDNDSISNDVNNFQDVVAVSNSLKLRGINTQTAANQVYTLQNTFDNLNKLFLVISILILVIGSFLCAVLLIKLQNTRYHEVGILSALGFSKQQITSMIQKENLLLSALAMAVNLVLLGCSLLICNVWGFSLIVTGTQVILSAVATFALVLLLSGAASYRLIQTEPAKALQK